MLQLKGSYITDQNINTIITLLEPSTKLSNYFTHQAIQLSGATNVPSEAVFSVAKHILSAVQNRLDDEKACASMCLKTWYDLE
ncbi:4661_t:CDS:2 [Gigaspora margarita]|uniref:4661_t:CDS:1 n=1 Tax=Gigaspora margarita TaxID=4874 RepID=A0ABN7VKY0_GIGMA|nr:4661_t:CDS:2 [Gigaspora margarita]